ncbi:MAG TPA: gliding motility-associated C-terminal domain-containing protein [Mucilaginibacter sp.]|nr:gliding motility-associated C-terminal domain-containing protein [Mucilaginibacter sp.]
MWPYRNFLVIIFLFVSAIAYGQQDVEFHLNAHLLPGKTIIKVKRDFYDPYLWVLAKNNEIYRVNSLTNQIDNYTPQFATYNNLEFIDIVGRSQDIVFIATRSTNVIQYKSGTLKLIGAANGIPAIVNSVGIDKTGNYLGGKLPNALMIGTDHGFCQYDITAESPVKVLNDGLSQVYEATYRTAMYKDSSSTFSNVVRGDSIKYLPAMITGEAGSTIVDYLWEGGNEFGYHINTAYRANASIYDYDLLVDYTNLFWGNSKGMFQNNANRSQYPIGSHLHYLNGINVNKITSLYGLVAFGSGSSYNNPGPVKENLLVGTDQGLYFSNSIYNDFQLPNGFTNQLRQFSLVHFDELGNIRVNDICVNAASITAPICEDGVWLACDDGLYLVKPDYAKYLNSQQFHAVSFEGQDSQVTDTKICEGTSVTAVLNTNVGTGNAVQWYKNGQELPAEIKDKLIINAAGEYYALLYDPCQNVHLESNHLTVEVITAPDFSFNYPTKMPYCNNTPVVLKTDDNPAYTYRWYTNGVLNGETTSSFTITETGKYKVEVSACTDSWVPSKEVEVDLITLPVPEITADKVVYCAEDQATLSLNTPTDAGYTINWYRDGNLLTADKDLTTIKTTIAGTYTVTIKSTIADCSQSALPKQVSFTPSPVFIFNYPDELRYCSGTPVILKAEGSANYQYRWYKDNVLIGDITSTLSITQTGKYKVEVSSCVGSWVSSKEVQVDVVQLPVPVIKTDKPAYCIGDQAILTVNVPASTSYTINWYRDKVLLTDNQDKTSLTTSVAGNYTVSVKNNEANSDGSICLQNSTSQSLVFNPPPTASIEQIIKTTLCEGQAIGLKVNHTDGTVKWSTGETTDLISVTTPGNYKVSVTSAAGCITEANTNVVFLPNPVFNMNDMSICTYTHQVGTLTAPPGFAKYTWNGQPGEQTYQVNHPQAVILTVTDDNGCQATKQVNVTEQCADVHIPNTFTPNGDGINDTWNIGGLEDDQTASVKVFSRYGQLVYESKGYGTPWNGSKGNKQLPTGTYYYVITAKNGQDKFSGYVAIIY